LWSDWWSLLHVSRQLFVIFTNILLVNGKSFFRSQKTSDSLLMSFCSIRIMDDYIFIHQKPTCRVTGDVCFMFPAKNMLYLLLICYWVMKKHFSEIKKTSDSFLLMSFSSIRNMAGYIIISPKINLWSDWWCFLAISSQSFDVFTFNMLLVNEKLFFRSQKTSNSFSYEL